MPPGDEPDGADYKSRDPFLILGCLALGWLALIACGCGALLVTMVNG